MIDYFIGYKLSQRKEGFSSAKSIPIVYYTITIGVAILAAFLAYNCNKNESNRMKIGSTIFAFLFSSFYLIWYVIYRLILKKPCPVDENSNK